MRASGEQQQDPGGQEEDGAHRARGDRCAEPVPRRQDEVPVGDGQRERREGPSLAHEGLLASSRHQHHAAEEQEAEAVAEVEADPCLPHVRPRREPESRAPHHLGQPRVGGGEATRAVRREWRGHDVRKAQHEEWERPGEEQVAAQLGQRRRGLTRNSAAAPTVSSPQMGHRRGVGGPSRTRLTTRPTTWPATSSAPRSPRIGSPTRRSATTSRTAVASHSPTYTTRNSLSASALSRRYPRWAAATCGITRALRARTVNTAAVTPSTTRRAMSLCTIGGHAIAAGARWQGAGVRARAAFRGAPGAYDGRTPSTPPGGP